MSLRAFYLGLRPFETLSGLNSDQPRSGPGLEEILDPLPEQLICNIGAHSPQLFDLIM